MRLFEKIFGLRSSPEAERAKANIKKSSEEPPKPQGVYNAVASGAEIRDRFFAVID
jgi:hypothetical protein